MSEHPRLPKEGKVLEIWKKRARRKKEKGVLSLVVPHAAPQVAGG